MNSPVRAATPASRTLFVVFVALAVFSAFVPPVLLIHRSRILPWLLVCAVFGAVTSLAWIRGRNPRAVTYLERTATALAGLYLASSGAVMAFAGYGLGRVLDHTFHYGYPGRWGRALAMGFGAVFFMGAFALVAERVGTDLFPKTGIGNAPLYPKLTWRKLIGWGLPVLAVAVYLIFRIQHGSWWAPFVLETVVVFGTAPLYPRTGTRLAPAENRARAAFERMLDASGYQVIPRIDTGQASYDSLISVFDLVVRRAGSLLAVVFKTADTSAGRQAPPVTWPEASAIPGALWAVRKAVLAKHPEVTDVEAVLVLAGRPADPPLVEFAEEEAVRVVELDQSTVDRIMNGELSGSGLQAVAANHLATPMASRSRS